MEMVLICVAQLLPHLRWCTAQPLMQYNVSLGAHQAGQTLWGRLLCTWSRRLGVHGHEALQQVILRTGS